MITARDINDKLLEVGGSRVRKYLKTQVSEIASTTSYLLNSVRSNEEKIVASNGEEYVAPDYHFFDIGLKKGIDIGKIFFNEPSLLQKKPCVSLKDGDIYGVLEEEKYDEIRARKVAEQKKLEEAFSSSPDNEGKKFKVENIPQLTSKEWDRVDMNKVFDSKLILTPAELDVRMNDYIETSRKQWTTSQIDKKHLTLFDLYSVVAQTSRKKVSIRIGGSTVPKEICDLLEFNTSIIVLDESIVRTEDLIDTSEALLLLFR